MGLGYILLKKNSETIQLQLTRMKNKTPIIVTKNIRGKTNGIKKIRVILTVTSTK